MNYSKDSQVKKTERTHRVCKKCDRNRLIKFYEKSTSLICEECKRRAKRVKKQSNIGKIKKELEDLVKVVAKERDNWTCQKCGKEVTGLGAHASHVIPVSASQFLRFDLQNLKCLCYHCHFNWWHKNPLEASEWFKNKFPERHEYLQNNKHTIDQRTKEELLELINKYKLTNK